MVETDGLENRYARNGIEGSNPSASALHRNCHTGNRIVSSNLTPTATKIVLLKMNFVEIIPRVFYHKPWLD